MTCWRRAIRRSSPPAEGTSCGSRVRLQTGPLYRHLARLLDDGLVAEVDGSGEDADDRRRTYALTPFGREVLALEGERLAAIVARGRALGVIRG